jgi:hypothetical protein
VNIVNDTNTEDNGWLTSEECIREAASDLSGDLEGLSHGFSILASGLGRLAGSLRASVPKKGLPTKTFLHTEQGRTAVWAELLVLRELFLRLRDTVESGVDDYPVTNRLDVLCGELVLYLDRCRDGGDTAGAIAHINRRLNQHRLVLHEEVAE